MPGGSRSDPMWDGPVPLQLESCSAWHAMRPGQLFFCPGELKTNRPEEIGRQLAHLGSVALGKRYAPLPACLSA